MNGVPADSDAGKLWFTNARAPAKYPMNVPSTVIQTEAFVQLLSCTERMIRSGVASS
jgi:hypothetical protein